MSDPRAYDEMVRSELQRHAERRVDPRLVALEKQVAELSAELAQREAELARGRAEAVAQGRDEDRELRLTSTEAQLRSAEDRARVAATERDAALRELERRNAALEQGRERNAASAIAELQKAREAAEERSRRLSGEYRARVRELEQLVSTLTWALAQTKQDIDRAAGSRAWRWGHGATRTLRRLALRPKVTDGALARALKRIEQLEEGAALPPPAAAPAAAKPGALPAPPAAADERSEEERTEDRAHLATEIRERLGPPPSLSHWPPVSIVVPTRNGREHLERLIAGLQDRTDYPELELVVVDNDSDDGTRELLAGLDCSFPLSVIANAEPASFSQANAQGAERARNDLILFLNNDVEPFEPGWLRELVAAHERDGVSAAGATLLRSPSGPD
ncbi:MAG TPA: glycosyltransferase, partial [Solirubrobacterales bacterium]|nr:glycosyltransferase [Solirubrobacterales bacterium]